MVAVGRRDQSRQSNFSLKVLYKIGGEKRILSKNIVFFFYSFGDIYSISHFKKLYSREFFLHAEYIFMLHKTSSLSPYVTFLRESSQGQISKHEL